MTVFLLAMGVGGSLSTMTLSLWYAKRWHIKKFVTHAQRNLDFGTYWEARKASEDWDKAAKISAWLGLMFSVALATSFLMGL